MLQRDVKKEVEHLREAINKANYRYYTLSDPEISDKEYDELLDRLKYLEKIFPQLIIFDSPTQRLTGQLLKGFVTVRHKKKMLSLDNTYSIDELQKWEDKMKKIMENFGRIEYIVEPKIDGVSCSLTYKKGVFSLGSTRGNGEIGENVTSNLRIVKSIPLRLIGDFPQIIELRGEIYIDKKDFKQLNKERVKSGEAPFANPRNAASGSLKLLDPSVVAGRNLKCLVHSFGWAQGHGLDTENDFLTEVKTWGLSVVSHAKLCRNLDEAVIYCRVLEGKRDDLNYEVDGAVVKVNGFSLQKKLGATLKAPRWAVAYKFSAHQATTKVKYVELGVGRTGIITPVAILQPVKCGGVTISRATLHNFNEIERLGIRKGDTVLLERAGEVIPKIIKVILSKRTGKETKIKVPLNCPACKSCVNKEGADKVYWYCINPDCPAQLKRSLKHFASKNAMDIEGMGESIVDCLVEHKLVKGMADIYKLTKSDFITLPLIKEKKAANLISAIEKSKKKPLSNFIYALGIRHVGEKAALVLAEKFKFLNNFIYSKNTELEATFEIGPVVALSIVNFFFLPKVKKMIKDLEDAGLNLVQEEKVTISRKFQGKIFVFTGELESFSRSQAKRMVVELGGQWSLSVGKKVDFVVVGKNPGLKYDKAKKLGISVINETDFIDLAK